MAVQSVGEMRSEWEKAGAEEDSTSRRVFSAGADCSIPGVVQVEAAFMRGFSGLQMIGNTAEVCRDGKERARAALESCGLYIPARKIVLSLTPGDVRIDGNHFDLPIAVALACLIAGRETLVDPSSMVFAAELGLKGDLRKARGIVAMAASALQAGLRTMIVARENLPELASFVNLLPGAHLRILAAEHLQDILSWIFEGDGSRLAGPEACILEEVKDTCDFDDMFLSDEQRLLAMAAASGRHHLLLRGTPGSGKSMFAARLPSIMPAMAADEHVESLRIHSSYSQTLPPALLSGKPPFRSPHHQASSASLLGTAYGPGELSLAHGGILFMDEMTEFRRDLLESLREPLSEGVVAVARAERKVAWKAGVLLVAACNNCPCGWYQSKRRKCFCPMNRLLAYNNRLSGPLLDRIDLHYLLPEREISIAEFLGSVRQLRGQTESMRAAVQRARSFGVQRNAALGLTWNRQLTLTQAQTASGLGEGELAKIIAAVPTSSSTRALVNGLRVARTLADLRESVKIGAEDFDVAWRWQAESVARQLCLPQG